MGRGVNLIGAFVVKYRYQRGWTQDMLAARLQRLGCDISAQVLANIETQRSGANDTLLGYLAKAFNIGVEELFPSAWGGKPPVVKLAIDSAIAVPRKKSKSNK